MTNIQQNLSHMVMGVVAIIAVTLLSLHGTISGGEALGVIGAATGFTMGVSGGSASSTGVTASLPGNSLSPGQTVTETVTHAVQASSPTPPAS